jgi:diadenosine tetraphosphatase ApaH/serine/threonine PP2A family protein phosphatase
MRYLVISDIHANLEALDAVLAETAGEPLDGTLVLGDLVGYGPDPNAVVDRVRALEGTTVIRGNHDKVAAGLEASDRFNHYARLAIDWTARSLTPERRAYLAALPAGPLEIDALVVICHGTPFDEDVYVFDELDALRAIRAASRPLCLFGHTHVAAVFQQHHDELRAIGPRTRPFDVRLAGDGCWLVNCGSVGQPRDGDWRAAYGLVDTDTRQVTLRCVEYDVATTQHKIMAAGLPELLAQRLSVGR